MHGLSGTSVDAQHGNHEGNPAVLAVAPSTLNRRIAEIVARQEGWRLTVVDSATARAEARAIVICERDPGDSLWREAVSRWAQVSPRPHVMLVSRSTDVNLWTEFQRLGGSDILRSPLDPEALVRAVKRGWDLWNGRQQITPFRTA